jgi:hypothetical protein
MPASATGAASLRNKENAFLKTMRPHVLLQVDVIGTQLRNELEPRR